MAERVLRGTKEEAQRLNMSPKTLRKLARNGEIRFVLVGNRMNFTDEDEQEFIERRRQACALSNEKARHTGNTISSSTVFDFQALRKKRAAEKQK